MEKTLELNKTLPFLSINKLDKLRSMSMLPEVTHLALEVLRDIVGFINFADHESHDEFDKICNEKVESFRSSIKEIYKNNGLHEERIFGLTGHITADFREVVMELQKFVKDKQNWTGTNN